MTRDEEVVAYFNNHEGKFFCNACIAKAVGINQTQASNATRPLGATICYDRRHGLCYQCRQQREVTRKVHTEEIVDFFIKAATQGDTKAQTVIDMIVKKTKLTRTDT